MIWPRDAKSSSRHLLKLGLPHYHIWMCLKSRWVTLQNVYSVYIYIYTHHEPINHWIDCSSSFLVTRQPHTGCCREIQGSQLWTPMQQMLRGWVVSCCWNLKLLIHTYSTLVREAWLFVSFILWSPCLVLVRVRSPDHWSCFCLTKIRRFAMISLAKSHHWFSTDPKLFNDRIYIRTCMKKKDYWWIGF